MSDAPRDFSTISPSARSLLIMKAQTDIPFAAEAARLAWGQAAVDADLAEMNGQPGAAIRRRHFEARYRSLDTLLADAGLPQIVELGGGFSFRGLELARRQAVFYLDTDLPEVAALKAELVARLHPGALVGTLHVAPLDALDADAFRAAVARFPPGPLAIVNEGLLVYLDESEKRRLAANVREALTEHGGVWLTADIYVRAAAAAAAVGLAGPAGLPRDARMQAFLDRHRVDENKFGGWEEAERFFTSEGFTVRRKLSPSDDPTHVRESWALAPRS
jgi:O-methyltransferase involved in polyketide biosynthesis